MFDIGGMMAETTATVQSDPGLGTGQKCKQVAKKSTTNQPLRNGFVKSRPLSASQSPTDDKTVANSTAVNGDSILLATVAGDNENCEAGIISHTGDDGNCHSHSKAQHELESESESDKIVMHSEHNSDIDSNNSVLSGTSALNGNCSVDTALLNDGQSAVEFAKENSSSVTLAADATNTLSDITSHIKPTDRTKRPNSATSLSDVDSKKARLENRQESLSSKKMIYDLCMEYSRLNASQEVADLKKRIVDLEDSVERWKTMAFELQKQLDVFRLEESKAAVPPISPTAKTKSPSVAPPKMTTRSSPVTKSTAVSSSTSPIIPLNVIQPTFARQSIMPRTSPSMLLAASARLRMPLSSSSAAAAPVCVAKSSQSVIDLTDDETPVASLRSDQQQHLMPPPPLQVGMRAAIVAPTGIATPVLSQIRPGALILNSVSSSTLMHPVAVTAVRQPPVPIGARFQTPIRAVPMRAVQPTPQSYGLTHPAPLPLENAQSQPKAPPSAKQIPQKPMLKLSRVSQGIVLSWNMPPSDAHENAVQYHLYAYQQGQEPPSRSLWKKVGSVGALPLPMACTLTQFQAGNSYHFAVRAVDRFNRVGLFSEPGTIHLEAGS